MRKNNPAVFECTSPSHIHRWKRIDNGESVCTHCGLRLNKRDTDDCFHDCSTLVVKN
jgi:hypothetical protein